MCVSNPNKINHYLTVNNSYQTKKKKSCYFYTWYRRKTYVTRMKNLYSILTFHVIMSGKDVK